MKTKINIEGLDEQIYFDNCAHMVEQFRETLSGSRTEFTTRSIFICIFNQEDFIKHISKVSHQFTTVKNETKILNLLVKEAKIAYNKEYEEFYQALKKERAK